MSIPSPYVVACNGAEVEDSLKLVAKKIIPLEYRKGFVGQNINASLPSFVSKVSHIPDRCLDLLEIGLYIFAADRMVGRGDRNSVTFDNWARSFHFVIKVRDYDFWERDVTKNLLRTALCYMTGDREYSFTFLPGHRTNPIDLFDSAEFKLTAKDKACVTLFSGGLDSLTGIADELVNTNKHLYLISHQSQSGTKKTQENLFLALKRKYPKRLDHYKFECTLKGVRAVEETQRTRSFLYSSIAYSIAHTLKLKSISVYENGITSVNFSRRQDLINARASRTTHPKTLHSMQNLFSEMEGDTFKIQMPFLWKTKSDVFTLLSELGYQDLITSTVSCTRTFQNTNESTHCGSCFQCIDRRFSAYSSNLDDIDDSVVYASNFINKSVVNPETRTTLLDYVRTAINFATISDDKFYRQRLDELVDLVDSFPERTETEIVDDIFCLCRRHGEQILYAINKMRNTYDNITIPLEEKSFLKLVAEREYLKEPKRRLIDSISAKLQLTIPVAFRINPPKDENDFNDKVDALLTNDRDEFIREHPSIRFALAKTVPDHATKDFELLIESKYVRGATTPSKITDGIAADMIKYPTDSHILFVIYDPQRKIHVDSTFKNDFEAKGNCTILIIR